MAFFWLFVQWGYFCDKYMGQNNASPVICPYLGIWPKLCVTLPFLPARHPGSGTSQKGGIEYLSTALVAVSLKRAASQHSSPLTSPSPVREQQSASGISYQEVASLFLLLFSSCEPQEKIKDVRIWGVFFWRVGIHEKAGGQGATDAQGLPSPYPGAKVFS